MRHATLVLDMSTEHLTRTFADGHADGLRLFESPPAPKAALRVLPESLADLLLANCISPIPLHKTLVLLEALAQHQDEHLSGHERLALAAALLNGISNLHFGPEVGVGPAKPDAPVVTGRILTVPLLWPQGEACPVPRAT